MDDFLHFNQVFTFGIALLHLIAIIPLQTSEIHRKALIAVLQALSVIRCMNNIKTTFSPALQEATGKIEYGLTNDYMFRVLFQKNKKALTGLVCSLLHLNPEEITSIEITNPVEIVILSILVYTLFSRMFDLMQPPVVKHSIAVA